MSPLAGAILAIVCVIYLVAQDWDSWGYAILKFVGISIVIIVTIAICSLI